MDLRVVLLLVFIVPFSEAAVPDPPENVTVDSQSSRTVNISWTAGFNGNSTILDYKVLISEDAGQTWNVVSCQGSSAPNICNVSATSASLKDLSPATMYQIQVFARNQVGLSGPSSAVGVTTDEEGPAAPPQNVREVNKTSTSIWIEWDEVEASKQNGLIVSYTVTYISLTEGHSGSESVAAPTRYLNLTGLREYVTYSITVLASTAKGAGPQSSAQEFTTDEDTPDAPPQNVREVNKTSTSIKIEWDEVKPCQRNGIILYYTITFSSLTESHSGSENVTAPTRYLNLTGLREYVTYIITVFASTVKGGGPQSSAQQFTTDEDKPGVPPQNVQEVNKTSTSIWIEWGEVEPFERNGIILSYTVHFSSLTENHSGSRNVPAPTRYLNLTGLREYVTYIITVSASTVKGAGPQSNAQEFTTEEDTPAAPPQNVREVNKTSTSIWIEWDEVEASKQNGLIVSYTVTYISLTEGHSGSESVAAPTRYLNLTGLREYVTYSITVLASTAKGAGPQSSAQEFTTDEDTPDAPPQNVREVNKTSTSIKIEWDEVKPCQRNGIILYYTVTFSSLTESHSGSENVTATTRYLNLTGLREYVTYIITVFASTVKGGGPQSSAQQFTTDEDKPGAPPQNVQEVNKTSTSIWIEWGEVEPFERNGVIVSYTVTFSSLTECHLESRNVTAPTRYLNLTGLREYVTYIITVSASTAEGAGPQSNAQEFTTDEDKPSAAPQNVRETDTASTSVLVEWDEVPSADQNGVILRYNVSYQAVGFNHNGWRNVSAPTREVNLIDLVKNKTYLIKVLATTVKGDGPFSVPIRALTNQEKPTAAPENVQGHNTSSTSILVMWGEVPTADRNGIIESYTVNYQSQIENDAGSKSVNAPTLHLELTGLKEYVNYNITVLATTVKGDGPPSNVIVVTTDQDAPSAPPQNIKGENKSSTSILVTWDDVRETDRNGIILSYTASYYVKSGGEITTQRIDAPANMTILTNLAKYTEYSITVLATTEKGDGPPTVAIYVTTDQDTPSEAPQNIRLEVKGTTTILVKWDDVPLQFRHGIITGYKILYKAEGNVATKSTSGRNGTLTGLLQFTTYTIQVLAVTVKGDGKESEPQSAQTEAPPTLSPPSEDNIGKTEVSVPLVNKETLANGEKASHVQMIVILLEEGGDPGNSGEERYKPNNLQGKSYKEDLKPGDVYISAEFSYGVVKDSFPVGDGKRYSRNGVTEANRRRRRRETSAISYLNGALQDGTKYAVFQRSFDAGTYYENEGFITFTTAKDYTVVIIVVSVVVPLVLLCLLLVACFRHERNKKNKREERVHRVTSMPSQELIEMSSSQRKTQNDGFDNQVAEAVTYETIPAQHEATTAGQAAHYEVINTGQAPHYTNTDVDQTVIYEAINTRQASRVKPVKADQAPHNATTNTGQVPHYATTTASQTPHYEALNTGQAPHYATGNAERAPHNATGNAGQTTSHPATRNAGQAPPYATGNAGQTSHYEALNEGQAGHPDASTHINQTALYEAINTRQAPHYEALNTGQAPHYEALNTGQTAHYEALNTGQAPHYGTTDGSQASHYRALNMGQGTEYDDVIVGQPGYYEDWSSFPTSN